jgi:hypothetical protein
LGSVYFIFVKLFNGDRPYIFKVCQDLNSHPLYIIYMMSLSTELWSRNREECLYSHQFLPVIILLKYWNDRSNSVNISKSKATYKQNSLPSWSSNCDQVTPIMKGYLINNY